MSLALVLPFPLAFRPVAILVFLAVSASLVGLDGLFFGCPDKLALNRRDWWATLATSSARGRKQRERGDEDNGPDERRWPHCSCLPAPAKTPLSPGRRHEALFALSLESISIRGSARPVVPLLELVQSRRFDARNKRHRSKLLKDDSLLEFVAYNEDASVRLRMAAEAQQRYRESARAGGVQLWRAEQVEACCRRLGEDGEPVVL